MRSPATRRGTSPTSRRSTRWSSAPPQRGIRVLPTVYGTPAWVAEDLDGYDCGDACGTYAPHSPEALAEWKGFIAALVERWGPGGTLWEGHPEVDATPVRTWQIWNEQNSPTFFQPKVDPGAYAALLEASSEAIKERDEDAEIVLGGMFGTPFKGEPPALTAPDFLRQLYAIDGARDNFDDVAAHPYAPRKVKIEQQVSSSATRSRPPTTTPGCGSPRSAPPPTTAPSARSPARSSAARRARRSCSRRRSSSSSSSARSGTSRG